MTRDQITAILDKHSPFKPVDSKKHPTVYQDWVMDAVMEVVEMEREACALICHGIEMKRWDQYKMAAHPYTEGMSDGASECVDAIRDRSA